MLVSGEFHGKNRHLDYEEEPFSSGQIDSVWGLENDSTFWFHQFPDFSSLSHCVWDSRFQSALHSCTCRALLTFFFFFWDAISRIPTNQEIIVAFSLAVGLQRNVFIVVWLKEGIEPRGEQAVLYGLIHKCSASSSLINC